MLDVAKPAIPFDTKHLDRLMDEAGIDVLVANSKHNIQYLLGGHRSIFFDYMDAMGIRGKRVGVEMAFLPADAAAALASGLPGSEIKNALFVLERLRAKKRPEELALLRKASELVVDSMKATMAKAVPG